MSVVQISTIRIGVVNFLNAAPLIDGIAAVDGIELVPKVPSELIGCLERGEVDVALASSIDYQRSSIDLGVLPVGVLSSDGESLTVQLCSRVPFQQVTRVHCDSDSHASVALLQIILQNLYGINPEIVTTNLQLMNQSDSAWPETVLMIGDKVVTSHCESEYQYTLDLGQAWKEQTGLPFVFATWFGKLDLPKSKIRKVSMLLQRQRLYNEHRIEQVVSLHASDRGWEPTQALQYVTKHMNYQFTDAHHESLLLFYTLAKSCNLLQSVRPLHILNP